MNFSTALSQYAGRSRPRHECYASLSVDWLTPPHILNSLGPFDLDPCACGAQPWPTAAAQYTQQEDGLSQPWHGRVWLNPPYGRGVIRWMRRLSEHGTGTALIFARTETATFFEAVWRSPTATAAFFLERRLHFLRPDGSRADNFAPAASVLVAYGAGDAAALARCGLPGRLVPL